MAPIMIGAIVALGAGGLYLATRDDGEKTGGAKGDAEASAAAAAQKLREAEAAKARAAEVQRQAATAQEKAQADALAKAADDALRRARESADLQADFLAKLKAGYLTSADGQLVLDTNLGKMTGAEITMINIKLDAAVAALTLDPRTAIILPATPPAGPVVYPPADVDDDCAPDAIRDEYLCRCCKQCADGSRPVNNKCASGEARPPTPTPALGSPAQRGVPLETFIQAWREIMLPGGGFDPSGKPY
jgi:hypothetical protein